MVKPGSDTSLLQFAFAVRLRTYAYELILKRLVAPTLVSLAG